MKQIPSYFFQSKYIKIKELILEFLCKLNILQKFTDFVNFQINSESSQFMKFSTVTSVVP